MKINNISLLIISIVIILSCKKENDFYEVGRQEVTLFYPVADTLVKLNRNKLDSLFRFTWQTKRNFIDFNLLFSLDKSKIKTSVKIPAGIKKEFYISGKEIDSILNIFAVPIGQEATLYWSVDIIDPKAGWCDDVRPLRIIR